MNLEKLKLILIENNIFVREKPKNFICKCPYCGDHSDPSKQGHLYVSKNSDIPVAHCWLCKSVPIPKLIKDLTGNKNLYKEVISDDELNQSYNQSTQNQNSETTRRFKIPNISEDRFSEKKFYIQKRTCNKMKAEEVPNLIVNLLDFISINHLDIVGKGKLLSDWEVDLLHRNFVCFLSANHSLLYCRNIDDNAKYKFRKIPLNTTNFSMLDYWKIPVNDYGNTVVLSEGNFDILGEYAFDTLDVKTDVRMYASGNTFSYGELLKSVCYDCSIYQADVIILSDSDKPVYAYKKFLSENSHLIKSCKIYMNSLGKDFGAFPIKPIRII